MADDGTRITVTRNGPYEVVGNVPLSRWTIVPNEQGESWEWRKDEDLDAGPAYRLCRCGNSSNKPFCDDTHLRMPFDGTETASRAPYIEQAEAWEGPELVLTDALPLCAFSRFCDAKGQVWNLVEKGDPESVELTEREAKHCVSGRLVAWRRNAEGAQPLEEEFEPSIAVVEDPGIGVSSALWVRGGIPVVSDDGTLYEVRNRVALCRCGASQNKPFCDGSHAAIEWKDENAGRTTATP